jgi:serine/threonine protein kinase
MVFCTTWSLAMAALNPRLADLSDNDLRVLDSWLVEFDRRWNEDLLAKRLDQIPPGSSWRLPALAEMVKIDLQRQWRRGRQVSLESYLEQFPELGSPRNVSADLIQAEYEVRFQFGAPVPLDDYVRRFPHQADELARLIAQGRSALARRSSAAAFSHSSARAQRPVTTPEPLPEQFGRYRIIKRLGQGGMGSVYLAQDTYLERLVALKVPDFGSDEDPEARGRFLGEARAAATLEHPYLCPVYDAGEIDGQLYLTMAYIEGQPLAALIGNEGWPERQVAALVGKLALALQEAHRQKVVHRDLKPANIMIKTTGQRREPVIVDFGLARRENPQDQRLTKTGQVVGTLGYMAPEQIRGELHEIGPACDIYALGVILYELLTGRVPFSGSGLAVAGQILTATPLPPSTYRADLDPVLEAICLKAMSKAVGDRYATMAELAAALTAFLQVSSASPTTTAQAGSPAMPSPTSSEQPQPAGSNSLVGQFLSQLAGNKVSPPSIPTPEPVASRATSPERHRPPWPTIVASGVLGVSLLLVTIYLVTDTDRIRITVDGLAKAKSADTKKAPEQSPRPEAPVLASQAPPLQDRKAPSVPELKSEAPKVEFERLFNGMDLTGWKAHPKQPGNWRVEDGILIGSGPQNSHLYSTRGSYRDFHLWVSARINIGGNSGVFVRASSELARPANNPWWPDGYEAQINSTHSNQDRTGSLRAGINGTPVIVVRDSLIPPGQWFDLELIVEGNRIVIIVDGRKTAEYIDEKRLYTIGHIVLQQMSGSLVEFRKIEIKELNGTASGTGGPDEGSAQTVVGAPPASPATIPPPREAPVPFSLDGKMKEPASSSVAAKANTNGGFQPR